MALVVLLKGINVGGHRSFRPSVLARQLEDFGAVNLGAAGTFVVRERVRPAVLRAEVQRRLPFDAEIVICTRAEMLRFTDSEPFAGMKARHDIIRFTSVLAKRGRRMPVLPLSIPPRGRWSVRVLGCQGRFVFGLYRREMKAIRYLGELEKLLAVPVTTRQWSTMLAVANLLENGSAD